jgi:hypothetical protein
VELELEQGAACDPIRSDPMGILNKCSCASSTLGLKLRTFNPMGVFKYVSGADWSKGCLTPCFGRFVSKWLICATDEKSFVIEEVHGRQLSDQITRP